MSDIDIRALADLARLEMSDAEVERLQKEIPDILKFVEQIQQVHGDSKHAVPALRNVMRGDDDPIESGVHTQALLDAAPARKDDRIMVKQVISRKK